MECPACSHTRYAKTALPLVYECRKCKALYGSCSLGDSYTLVLPYWHTGEEKPENTRYFDLECLGSQGITRRHGWLDVTTKRVVQVG